MNAQRRKEIEKLISRLQDIREEIDTVKEDEQEAFENLPESLQNSERGETMEEAINCLDCALDGADNTISELEIIE